MKRQVSTLVKRTIVMDQEYTIFKNSNVFENFPINLFCRSRSNCNAINNCSCRSEWLASSPSYSTVRVNTILTSLVDVENLITEALTKEGEQRDLSPPTVNRHAVLSDCLVVPQWHRTRHKLPRHQREVIVDSACGAAVLRGANVFAPGVLGLLPNVEEGDMVSVYADSSNQCRQGLNIPFIDSGKVFVGNGILKMSRKHLFQKNIHPSPRGVAVAMRDSVSGVASISIASPLGLLQNLPSVVCGHVVAPLAGDRVLDLCAAPGHKTTHLAALINNKGLLIALDKIARKIECLRILCETMQASCVRAFAFDSTKAVSTTPGPDWAPPYAPGTFDRILLDAPCSALGQRPQIGSKITNKQIQSHPKLQRKLFASAVDLLKPGGTLVYSTCSLTTAENEDIVSWALNRFPHLRLVAAEPLLGRPGCFESSLSEADCHLVQRFGPPLGLKPEEDTIGFFIAKFIKDS